MNGRFALHRGRWRNATDAPVQERSFADRLAYNATCEPLSSLLEHPIPRSPLPYLVENRRRGLGDCVLRLEHGERLDGERAVVLPRLGPPHKSAGAVHDSRSRVSVHRPPLASPEDLIAVSPGRRMATETDVTGGKRAKRSILVSRQWPWTCAVATSSTSWKRSMGRPPRQERMSSPARMAYFHVDGMDNMAEGRDETIEPLIQRRPRIAWLAGILIAALISTMEAAERKSGSSWVSIQGRKLRSPLARRQAFAEQCQSANLSQTLPVFDAGRAKIDIKVMRKSQESLTGFQASAESSARLAPSPSMDVITASGLP